MIMKLLKPIGSKPVDSLTSRFRHVYENNLWGDTESASGAGSRRDSPAVQEAIAALDRTIRTYRLRSMIDLPCGDFNWIPYILGIHRNLKYRGFDIVPQLVERNRALYPSYRFDVLDATSAVPPKSDLIFSKDMVNHLTFVDIAKVFRNLRRSKSTYLLMSNNFGWSNVDLDENVGGNSRHLDVMSAPFHFPEAVWNSGYLGLWKISDIDERALDRMVNNH